MTDSLVPVLLLLLVAAGLAGVLLLLSTYLGRASHRHRRAAVPCRGRGIPTALHGGHRCVFA